MTSSVITKCNQKNITLFYDLLNRERSKINQSLELMVSQSKKGLNGESGIALVANTLAELSLDIPGLKLNQKNSIFKRNKKSVDSSVFKGLKRIMASVEYLFQEIQVSKIVEDKAAISPIVLQKQLKYCHAALNSAIEVLKDVNVDSDSDDEIKQSVNKVASLLERYVSVPSLIVQMYDDNDYLLANPDVKQGIIDGNILSGLEHFVNFGVNEVSCGDRKIKLESQSTMVSTDAVIASWVDCTEAEIQSVRSSGVIDEKWYIGEYGHCDDAVVHYCLNGARKNHKPNFYFDQEWYVRKNKDVIGSRKIPLLHYIQSGEKEGRSPSIYFDPKWYRKEYKLASYKGLMLGHYISIGRSLRNSPIKIIDHKFYEQNYHKVINTTVCFDFVEHACDEGWKEGFNPSEIFNLEYYRTKYLNSNTTINPIEHYLNLESKDKVYTSDIDENVSIDIFTGDRKVGDIAKNIQHFANPGNAFEESDTTLTSHLKPLAKVIAFYLPQFHAFEENDKWWGKGFSEWRNVARGTPRFDGHYQPRIPRDLGFYDLNSEDTIVEQAELAMKNGIEGFCFYYYWFNGKRLMNKPLDTFSDSSRVDMPFSIMWANENWTRTWDGLEKEVLIEQDYALEDEDAYIEDTLKYFKNENYIKVDGRPLFTIYRPGLVPDAKATFARWKAKWKAALGVEPWIIMVQGFGDTDPTVYELDGAIEFPPHKVCETTTAINDQLDLLDPNFHGHAVAYEEVIEKSLSDCNTDFPLIKTVVPHWDNDARREGRGFVMHGSTPKKYSTWLEGAIDHSVEKPFNGESFVFVNAWNEWAEGAYLEPDVHYGHAYLNATKQVVYGLEGDLDKNKIILVGHDAHRHGAQMLLLNLAKTYNKQFGMQVEILLKRGGALVSEYEKYASVHVLETGNELGLIKSLKLAGFNKAITNTSVTGDIVPLLKQQGIKVVSLIHELPTLIQEYGLEESVRDIAKKSDHIIFPAKFVEDGFLDISGEAKGKVVISPQGLYKNIEYDATAKHRICDELNISSESKIILNSGFADLRKGFDLFINTAKDMVAQDPNVHFVWIGGVAADLDRWLGCDVDASENIHCIGYTDKVEDYYNACDSFFLTSREDPYPSVVLEAMSVGKPVVIFKDTTGLDDVVSEYGMIVDRHNPSEIVEALFASINNKYSIDEKRRVSYINTDCQFDDYCFKLLEYLQPELKKISVVIPNYNYEQYIESRIESVFNQSYPIFEIIILDDKSSDNSNEVIDRYIDITRRIVRFEKNQKNSGNTFIQWDKGLSMVRGDYTWIAEADDLADKDFVTSSLATFNYDTVMSFCNSRQVDSYGFESAPSYNYYYDTINPSLFSGDFSILGKNLIDAAMSVKNPIMNVSSVVWRTSALSTALLDIKDEVLSYKLVGDWRLYLEVLGKNKSSVSYLSKSLNTHRRHDSSVTHSMDYEHHLNEISLIHDYLINNTDCSLSNKDEMSVYIQELELQFGLNKAA